MSYLISGPVQQSATRGDSQNPGGFAHVPALDGIRGLAILLVLFCHLFSANYESSSHLIRFFGALQQSSYIGVNLFFVLSGFLITGILLDTLPIAHFFKTFYARRALRIFPLYFGFLGLLLLLTRPLHFVWNGWQYFFLTYTANLALWRDQPLILPHFNINHFWSLQVEEQFYVFWPFLVYRLKRPQSLVHFCLWLCLGILLIRIVLVVFRSHFANIYLPYSATFSCADNLLYGCGLCALLRTSARRRILQFSTHIFLFCAMILLVMAFSYGGLVWETNFFVPTFGFSLLGIASAALIVMTMRSNSRTQRVFVHPVLRFFGKYSYGLYVIHYSVDRSLTVPVRHAVDAHFHSKALGVIAGSTVVMAISILLALLSYHLYEVHFLKLKHYFSYNTAT